MHRPRRIVHREMLADAVTPISAFRTLTRARPGRALLFESAPGAGACARRSMIALGGRGEVLVADGVVQVAVDGDVPRDTKSSPFDACRNVLAALRPTDGDVARAPYLGLFGAAAHEFSGYLEQLPRLPRADDPMPDLHLVVPESLIVFDHATHRATVTTLGSADGDVREDADLVDALHHRAQDEDPEVDRSGGKSPFDPEQGAATPAQSDAYRAAVALAKSAIYDGEAYQVVVSQGLRLKSAADPFDVYRALRSINPSPFMFYLDLGWGKLLGSSPEMLARLDGRSAAVRPLAGTRSRKLDASADRRQANALRRDPKERAEHIMLVDLGRNDLGRVCTAGSVRVVDFMGVERFSHVMHLVSEVRGELEPSRDAFDLFGAAFPAGTVSGAPKIRALELIAELEGVRRGFYAGSVLRVGFDGSMDSCITLRSMHAYGGAVHLRAGAGIVAASEPNRELRECRAKLGAALDALSMANAGLGS